MSTPDPADRPEQSGTGWGELAHGTGALPAVPDPAVLARLAAEFFTALPERPEPGVDAPVDGMDLRLPHDPERAPFGRRDIEVPVAQSEAIASAASDLGALPMTLGAIPSSAGRWSGAPAFSFLDVRPLFRSGAEAGSFPMPAAAPTTAWLTSLPNVPDVPTRPDPDAGAPAVPGTWLRPGATEQAAAYGFLGEIRQLVAPAPPAAGPAALAPTRPVAPEVGLSSRAFMVADIRRDFPILRERVHGRPLIWLDNAATTQKPDQVIDRLRHFYTHENSNIHRAAHTLAARATDAYEAARDKVRRFLNASSVREIVFVRGATEGINLVAQSWGRQNVRQGDEIVITWLEHHANIVPWQMLCTETGARLRVAPVDDSGQILLDEYAKLLGPRTRLVSLTHVSNALGTVTPAREMIEMAHRHGATVLLDGAQAISHMPVDVQAMDCDFYVFSGHKMFAPTGIGAVYGKAEVLEHTPPWQGGGSMIQDVTFERTVYQTPPARFEAGTGNIADAVGLGAAVDYLERVGMANVARYEHDLLEYATDGLQSVPGLHLIGTAREKAGVLSFVIDGLRTEDVGTALDREGIAVRAGHHCAQPILRRFNLESTVRASLALYNTCEEIDALVAALWTLTQGRRPSVF